MSSEWQEHRLGDITRWVSGGTPSKQNPEYWGGSIPWISASSMKAKVCADSDERITEEAVRSGARMCDPGTILLLVRGSELHKRIPIGVAAKRVAFNQDVKAITTCSDDLSGDYLYYLLKGNGDFLLNSVEFTGIGAGKLETPFLQDLLFPIPTRKEQKVITDFMIALDDKIELNRKTNETLEAIAKALFKSWFVDFDPVRAKAEGRPTGLPAEISDLFPDSFEDSELGEIPSGWEVKAISNLCQSISSGGTPSRKNSKYWIGGTISWFKTGELRDSFLLESEERITQAGLNESSCKYFDIGDILFALYGATVGKMGIVTAPSTANQAAACLRPLEEIGTPFLEGMLYATRERLMNIATGAAQQNLYLGVVKEHAVVAPCKPLPKMFSQLVDPISQRRLCCLKESSSLSSFRDALLPKLITGEIRIPDAEKMLEEVGI